MRGMKAVQTANREKRKDEYDRYCPQGQMECDDSIAWRTTTGKVQYPQLVQMAINIFSIPVLSDELEGVLSRFGMMITHRRNHLQCNAAQAAQCLCLWDNAGIINIRQKPVE